MGMPREPNDFLIDTAPALLQACGEALEAFQRIVAGRHPPMALDYYSRMLEKVIAEAQGPFGRNE
jgi:hypothetical protein